MSNYIVERRDTVAAVTMLEGAGLIATGRAAEILA